MLDLRALNAPKTTTVEIRGREFPVRTLTIAEQAAIEEQAPTPIVRGRTPEEREVHAAHPEFVKENTRAHLVQFALIAGAAATIDTGGDGGRWSASMTPEAAAAYADAIMQGLTRGEMARIHEALRGLSEFRPENIGTGSTPGNSSAPPPQPGQAGPQDGSSPTGTASPTVTSSSGSANASE